MRVTILLAVGITLWLGGSAIRGHYVTDDVGKGISAIGWLIIAFVAWFIVKNWFHKDN